MNNKKFQRSYRVTIELGDGIEPIIITLPFTIQFTVNRRLSASLNSLQLDILNLSPRVRDLIFQDQYVAKNKTITFEAGYDTLSIVFKGTIFRADSRRDGTNIVTSIQALSGSWDVNETTVYTTLDKGTTVGDVFKFLIGQFKELTLGAVSDFPEQTLRPVTLNGNVWDLLKRYTEGAGNSVFIDNNRVYVLKRQDVIEGDVTVISSASGILQTPQRSSGFITVQTIFQPQIKLSQSVNLDSTIMPIYNGTYKVMGVQHTGVISDAVGGDCRTMVDLFTGQIVFRTVIENG